MPNLAPPWPSKDPLADTDLPFGSDTAGGYWRNQLDKLTKQIVRRMHPAQIAGKWVPGDMPMVAVSGSAVQTGKTYFMPFRKRTIVTVDQIGAIQTGGTSGNCAFAIYASNNSTQRPSGTSPLAYTGSIALTGGAGTELAAAFAGGTGLAGGNFPFDLGPYWFAVQVSAAANFEFMMTGSGSQMNRIFGVDSIDEGSGEAAANQWNGVSCTSTFGTWPDANAATWTKQIGTNESSRFAGPNWRVA